MIVSTERKCRGCGTLLKHEKPSRLVIGKGKFCSQRCAFRNRAKKPYLERFWRNVSKTASCWIWNVQCDSGFYGTILDDDGVLWLAHRASYVINVGVIPDGLQVCHTCDNPRCVNPGHLFLGTITDNMQDKVAKGRHIKGIQCHTAKLDEKAVIEIRSKYHRGRVLMKDLAKVYGVSVSTVSMVLNNLVWKHV